MEYLAVIEILLNKEKVSSLSTEKGLQFRDDLARGFVTNGSFHWIIKSFVTESEEGCIVVFVLQCFGDCQMCDYSRTQLAQTIMKLLLSYGLADESTRFLRSRFISHLMIREFVPILRCPH